MVAVRGLDVEAQPIRNRRRLTKRVRRALVHVGLIIASVVFAYPLLWTIAGSFKPESQIFSLGLWTTTPTLENYHLVAEEIPLLRQILNSVIIAGSQTIGCLLFCSAAGFAFAKLKFPGQRVLFGLLLATVMVPNFVTILPAFIVMSHFGWVNTYQSVIVPGLASAFGIFFMRQYMHYIPDELLNAARVDGGNYWTVYWRIIIPVSWPALSVLGILTFVAAWNNYLWPLVMLRSTSMQPIVLGIASVPQGGVASVSLGAIMAGATCAVVPLLIVYIIFQRKIVSGLMRGAIQ